MRKIQYEAINNKKGIVYIVDFWEWPDGVKMISIRKEIRREGDNSFTIIEKIYDMNKKDLIYKRLKERVFPLIDADEWIFLLGTKYISARLTIDNFKKAVLTTLDLF
ncbi:hypothetical protein DRN75_03855 [Nanoarchaeota archaeon]|nr:MAG: hypothetical protein DRN75_03855 [Nanoarchaeota archaeon]